MTTTWILVTDASKARLYLGQKKNQSWTLLESIEHPESRAKAQDLVTDRQGRVSQSGNTHGGSPGKGSRSGMESISPKQNEHSHFARFLSDMLSKGFKEKAFDSLLIVANPQFLGILRTTLEPNVAKCVKASIDKDYTSLPQKELEERLADSWMYI